MKLKLNELFDQKVPLSLREIQKWFASIITIPLQKDNKLPCHDSTGNEIAETSKQYILPGPKLKSHERIELYHQQYWWRLIEVMQENFPALTRLFGYESFNQTIAIPYIHAHPASHYSLSRLGDKLSTWIQKCYKGTDKTLVLEFAKIDWAANKSFWVKNLPLIPSSFPMEKIVFTPLTLQPHVFLFSLKADLFTFRDEFLSKDVEHWSQNPFPDFKVEESYFVLYRSLHNDIHWKKLSKGGYLMLSFIKESFTIQEACEKLEEIGGDAFQEASEEISLWLYEWSSLGFFSI